MLRTLIYYIKKALKMPFYVLCQKLFSHAKSRILFYFGWFNDVFFYERSFLVLKKHDLGFSFDKSIVIDENFNIAIQNYLSHKFDLLGSGWINVNINPHANINYNPINWHKDHKSGFSWDAKTWYKFIEYGKVSGVDIKVPWELSRLQHLPQLAIAYKANDNDNYKDKIKLEFENQLIDFIDNNLPRFGVNWVCTMDVGIRAANIVLAYELFLSFGAKFERDFENRILNSIYEHGVHIVNNLEWSETLTSNHYLANITGLLFVSSVLDHPEADKWLYFSLNELLNEFSKQYYDDGVNFEASTSYHRLSTEMIVYSAAFILGFDSVQWRRIRNSYYVNYNNSLIRSDIINCELKEDKLPKWFISKLFKSLTFTHLLMKDNFEIPQIGDNDSGRFFKFSIPGDVITLNQAKEKYLNLKNLESDNSVYLDENILDHRSLSIALKSLFDFNVDYNSHLEENIFNLLSKGRRFDDFESPKPNKITSDGFLSVKELQYKKVFKYKNSFINNSILDNLNLFTFPVAGIYIYKCNGFYLLISACPNGQNGNGGHAHNDKLSFELSIDGKLEFFDPGTYLYTPDHVMRNKFRSVRAHNTIITNLEEQNTWVSGRFGLFNLVDLTECKLLYADKTKILLENTYKEVIHQRMFEIKLGELLISDFCNMPFEQNIGKFDLYSNGYGKLIKVSSHE